MIQNQRRIFETTRVVCGLLTIFICFFDGILWWETEISEANTENQENNEQIRIKTNCVQQMRHLFSDINVIIQIYSNFISNFAPLTIDDNQPPFQSMIFVLLNIIFLQVEW